MVQINDAGVPDARGIAEVQVASWRAGYRGLLPDEALANLSVEGCERMWADRFGQLGPRHTVLVAVRDEVIVGFASSGPCLDEAGPQVGQLYAIYVHPDAWRGGIGSALHTETLRRLRENDFTEAVLWVLDGNERADQFYRWAGWTDDGASRVDSGPGGVPLPDHRMRRSLGTG